MGQEELNGVYKRLRTELDAAYSGPVWNSARIDRIAEQIVRVEFALASAQSAGENAGSSGEPLPASHGHA